MKKQHFCTKLACERPMLKYVKRGLQRVWPVTTLFFLKFVSVWEPLKMSWFDVPTTQMPIFILFVSAAVLFGGALWVSLSHSEVLVP